MNPFAFIAAAALLAGASNIASAVETGGQPYADSTGGSSQARGGLGASDASLLPDASGPTRAAPADSTGESSAARAEYLLDHATTVALPGVASRTRNRYQPFLDSTGGNSRADSERALEAQGAAASRRTTVAIAPAAR